MRVWLRSGDVEAEIQVRLPFNPDVLHELCNRATELVITQRAADLVVIDDPEAP